MVYRLSKFGQRMNLKIVAKVKQHFHSMDPYFSSTIVMLNNRPIINNKNTINKYKKKTISKIVYLSSIMNNRKVSISSEICAQKLWMPIVGCHQFIDKSFISGFWKPTFFIKQCQNTHRLLIKRNINKRKQYKYLN